MQTQHPSAIKFGRLLLSVAALLLAAATIAETAPDLLVEKSSGAVKLRIHDRWLSPSDGMTVSLPATVSTGDDGSLVLIQDETKAVRSTMSHRANRTSFGLRRPTWLR